MRRINAAADLRDFLPKILADEYLSGLRIACEGTTASWGPSWTFSASGKRGRVPLFHPKGMVLRNELENSGGRSIKERGYQEIRTPMILSRHLWERSGHWDHYRENMYLRPSTKLILRSSP